MSEKAASPVSGTASPTDEWYAKWGGGSGRDFINVEVRMPSRVEMLVATYGSTPLLLATLRIGGVSFVHEVADMRLLLLSAIEQLDLAEQYAAEQDNTELPAHAQISTATIPGGTS
jgi:hypothetical protein